MSKTFMAAVVVLLDRQGLLRLDDPLSKYLPDFPRGGEIRLSHLLEHSSGVPDVYSLPEYPDLKRRRVSLDELVALLATKPLDFAPGSQSAYSNSGYALLAAVVRKVTGKSYHDVLREKVLVPLHLEAHRRLGLSGPTARAGRGIRALARPGGAHQLAFPRRVDPHGGGDLYSTVDDLYAWYRAVRERKLLWNGDYPCRKIQP